MKTKRLVDVFKKYKKSLFGTAFVLASMIVLSFGCSLTLSNRIDFGSQMSNIIRLNNKTNDEHQTYWRCEPIESRKDWLGWGVKSYLTSLANPWAVYGDENNNNCFLYTDSSAGQTFIRNKNTDELISISVFASPSSRSLSCFDIKLSSGSEADTKNDFYCSEHLAQLLNNDLSEQQLIVNCGSEVASNISFNGVIKSFGYDFVNKFLGGKDLYIVVPYIFEIDGKEKIVSYDMQNFTGQSSFYAVLKNDRYENNYYALMIDSIYQMGGVKDQLCYKGTYIDSFDDLQTQYELIESAVQKNYLNLVAQKSKGSTNLVCGIVMISISLISIAIMLIKMKRNFYAINVFNSIVSSSIALMVFWLFGEIFYKSNVTTVLFWDISGRIFAFIFVFVVTVIISVITTFMGKNRHKEKDNIEYYSIDI